jgi:hypothetical protein
MQAMMPVSPLLDGTSVKPKRTSSKFSQVFLKIELWSEIWSHSQVVIAVVVAAVVALVVAPVVVGDVYCLCFFFGGVEASVVGKLGD